MRNLIKVVLLSLFFLFAGNSYALAFCDAPNIFDCFFPDTYNAPIYVHSTPDEICKTWSPQQTITCSGTYIIAIYPGETPTKLTIDTTCPGTPDVEVMTGEQIDNFLRTATEDQLSQMNAHEIRDGRIPVFVEVTFTAGGTGTIAINVYCDEIEQEGVSTANNDNSGDGGDPVNTYNGELYFTEPYDLYLDGPIPLYFQRYYASYLARSFIIGDLGDNWLHNYDWRIHWTGNQLTLITERGKVLKYSSDGTGNWTLLTAADNPIPLTQDGNEILLRNPDNDYIYRFNAAGKLQEISDGKGNALSFTYLDVSPDWGKLSEVTDNQGRSLVFTYGYAGNIRKISTVREKQGATFYRSVNFSYGDSVADTHLVSFQNARGRFTAYTYEDTSTNADRALLLYKTMPRNNIPLQQTFFDTSAQFDSGKVKTQKDAYDNETTFSYSGNDATITGPDSQDVLHTHDSSGSLTSHTDKQGNQIAITNDSSKRRSNIQDPLTKSTIFNFDTATGMVNSFTDKNNNTTTYSYASRTTGGVAFKDLTGISYPDGTSESFTYDASGNLLTYTDQAGHEWAYTYDAGKVATITNPLGGVTTFTYTPADGTLASMKDDANNVTTFSYDNSKRLNLTTFADTSTAGTVFNEHNMRTSATDERGNVRKWQYDFNDNLDRVTDAANEYITHAYDNLDRVISTTDAQGHSSSVTYDALGRPAVFTNREGYTTTYGYNLRGNINSVTDRSGYVWSSTYNAAGNVASTTNPLNKTTIYSYDPNGSLTGITIPSGKQTVYTYDKMNRLTSVENPGGELTLYGYEERGLIDSITLDQAGISSSIAYDGLGGITTITDPNSQEWQRDYNKQGLLTQATDPIGNVTAYQYDNRNRVSRNTYPDSLGTLDILYDPAGNLLKQTYSDGLIIDYGHDVNDLRTSAINQASSHDVDFSYDVRHDLVETNGLIITRDAETRIKTIEYADSKILTYNYDKQGLLTSVQDWAAGTLSFEYDRARRLTKIIRPNGVTTTYTRDDDGNVSRQVDGNLADINITRDDNARITGIERTVPLEPVISLTTMPRTFDDAAQQNSYTYDAMGRLVDDGTRTYTWNLASHLLSYTENSVTTNFTFDAFGLPVSRGTRDYVWNWALSLPSVSTVKDNNIASFYYIYTPEGHLLYSIDAQDNSRQFYHFDQSGNTLFLTDDSGNVTNSYAYTPYGTISNSSGSDYNPFTYNGRFGVLQEGNSGLYFMRRRVYDASAGRFISREPVKDLIHPRTLNPYQFAARDPVNFVDPRGENNESASGEDIIGLGANLLSGFAEGLGLNAPEAKTISKATPKGIIDIKVTPPGSGVSTASKALGAAGTLIGTGVEIKKAFDKMDKAENKFHEANQTAWDDFRQKMKELNELYRSKENRKRPKGKRLTARKLREIRKKLKEALDLTLQANEDIFHADSIFAASVMMLNGATGWIPGAGLILDWDSVLSDYK